jgi:phosphatidylserine/phosphatidylglycerophosphate/cardiolipin synthase-like enzyme
MPADSSGFTVNHARALFDGAAHREMIALVARAQRTVRVAFFLFGGPVADAIIDVLAVKKAEGVQVQVTLDRKRGILPRVRRECRAAHRRLLAEGIDVVLSDPRPLPGTPPGRPAMSHHKILVVDEQEALVGGMNVGTLFMRWHDVMIHLRGPAAAVLARQFDQDRQFALGPPGLLPLPHIRAVDGLPLPELGADQSMARILGTGVGRRTTKEAVVRSLRAAHSSVYIAMSEIGRTDVLDEVIAVSRRGVDVRVLASPQGVGEFLPPVLGSLRARSPKAVLNAQAIRTLLNSRVPVRFFAGGDDLSLLHAKMAIFDARTAIVGSTNWTRGGFEWVGETDVELRGGQVIPELLSQFTLDWDRALPCTMPGHAMQLLCRCYERIAH